MNGVHEQLRRADPLPGDLRALEAARAELRRKVIEQSSSLSAEPPARSRRAALMAIAAVATATIAAGAVSMWSGAATVVAAVRFEVRLAEDAPAAGLTPASVEGSTRTIYLHDEVVVTNGHIQRTRVAEDMTPGRWRVEVVFTPEGQTRMQAATAGHIGRPVAILIDGRVVLAPTLRAIIADSAVITGSYTREEAERLAEGLRLGR